MGVVIRQCLSRRIYNKTTLEKEVEAWQADRNAKVVKVNWRFTTADARTKLKHLYPVIHVMTDHYICYKKKDFYCHLIHYYRPDFLGLCILHGIA